MRGAVFTGEREIGLMEFPDPTPGPDEVVVEMKASGMCGSDLHQYRRPKSGGEAIGALAIKLPLPPGALATLWQADDHFIDAYLKTYPGLL